MTGEHPVVCVCTVLTDRAWRGAYEANIVVFLGGQKVVLIALEEWNDLVCEVWVVQFFGFNQGRLDFFEFIAGVHQGIGNIFHVDQLLYEQPRIF